MPLIVGSQALKHHLDLGRDPTDIDLIGSRIDLEKILNRFGISHVLSGQNKVLFNFELINYEYEIAESGNSADLILNSMPVRGSLDCSIGAFEIADLETLFLLKRSHIWYPRKWSVHFRDYKSIQRTVGGLSADYEYILQKRIEETVQRYHFKDLNYNVRNDVFFRSSVKRYIPHDDIHRLLKHKDKPMFEYIKDDLNTANISQAKFESLSYEEKILNVREECMVLTCERFVVPAHFSSAPYKIKDWIHIIMRKLCTELLPSWMRLFAIDNYEVITGGISPTFYEKVIFSL